VAFQTKLEALPGTSRVNGFVLYENDRE